MRLLRDQKNVWSSRRTKTNVWERVFGKKKGRGRQMDEFALLDLVVLFLQAQE